MKMSAMVTREGPKGGKTRENGGSCIFYEPYQGGGQMSQKREGELSYRCLVPCQRDVTDRPPPSILRISLDSISMHPQDTN